MAQELNWPEDSPLWRIGLYRCTHVDLLQVGENGALEERQAELDRFVDLAGLSLVRSTIKPKQISISAGMHVYSDEADHGYTYHASIGKSGVMIHAYPEIGTVSINIETCADEEESEECCRKFGDMLYAHFGAQGRIFIEEVSRLPLLDPSLADAEELSAEAA